MTRARDLSKLLGTNNNGVIDNTNITLDANEVPNLDASKITTGELANARVADLPASKITSGTFAAARINNASLNNITALPSGVGGTAWQSVQTTGFTAVAGRGYPCNTTSAAFTVTLPASPSAGDTIILVDYAGTFDTNNLTINPNSNKLEGGTSNLVLSGDREGVTLTYIDLTQGWLATSGIQEGTDALSPPVYSIDFLVVAGGGGGGDTVGGGGAGGGYRTSTQTVTVGTVITVTVGDGGAAAPNIATLAGNGSDSSISGSGLTTITSAGGGYGGNYQVAGGAIGGNGGSGGGGGGSTSSGGAGGTGNTPSTSPSQGNNGGAGRASNAPFQGGGGGGAGAAGTSSAGGARGTGGDGTASSITGSSVTRAGGGGGGAADSSSNGLGGAGGGGAGGYNSPSGTSGVAGTVNTGGGGGGGRDFGCAAGGKGVVILRVPTANYSATTTGSPTVTTDGSFKVLQFNGSGSYTA